jgi:aryl-alcohol dehydrogenase-like predicted oxidoreductase
MWDIAAEIGGKDHHFSVAQLPMNLFESGPLLEKNCGPGETQSALEFAEAHRIGILVNRPLNAFVGNRLLRLAETKERGETAQDVVKSRLEPLLPVGIRGETLSRKALAVLANTKGVNCVLNGMRTPDYVDDSLGAMRMEPFGVTEELYRAFQLTH